MGIIFGGMTNSLTSFTNNTRTLVYYQLSMVSNSDYCLDLDFQWHLDAISGIDSWSGRHASANL